LASTELSVTLPIEAQVDEQLQLLDEQARELFRDSGTAAIHETTGGKLLRPRILLLCAVQAAGGDRSIPWDLARKAALAIEIAHLGTLYHDDIVDRSSTRRGAPALHVRVGSQVALLAGAHLLSLGFSLLAVLPSRIARRVGIAALRESDGQLREIERLGELDTKPEEYVRNAGRKTGSPFELAAFVGASIGGSSEIGCDAFARFGRQFGVTFQLFDDLDDFSASPSDHRPPLNDLRERIYTLPVLIACGRADEYSMKLRGLLGDRGDPLEDEAAREVHGLLVKGGAFAAAAERAHYEHAITVKLLGRLPPSEAREALSRLVESIALKHRVDRSKGSLQ